MTMEGNGNSIGPLIDADGHVLEPADTWQKYIDPKFQDRAIRIELDADGRERLLFDNKPFEFLKAILVGLEELISRKEDLASRRATIPMPKDRPLVDTTRRRALRCWTKKGSTGCSYTQPSVFVGRATFRTLR